MADLNRAKILVGNITIYPEKLKRYLLKSHYFMDYSEKENRVELFANHGRGGEPLFIINNIPYESAAKLAEGLGLKADGEYPTNWGKWNPVLQLNHDGSIEAESLRVELLRLGVPHTSVLLLS